MEGIGNLQAEEEHLQAGLALFRTLEDTTSIANTLEYLTGVYLVKAEIGKAETVLHECTTLRQLQKQTHGLVSCLEYYALIAFRRGDMEHVAAWFGTIRRYRALLKGGYSVFWQSRFKPDFEAIQALLNEARCQPALEAGKLRSISDVIAEILNNSVD